MWDGTAPIRRDDRVRFPGGLRSIQEWRRGSAALSHREGRQFESDLLDRGGGASRWARAGGPGSKGSSSVANARRPLVVIEVEAVETPGRDPGGRGFESPRSPQRTSSHEVRIAAGRDGDLAGFIRRAFLVRLQVLRLHAGVARVAEHLPCKQAVESSTLSTGSISSAGSTLRSACWRSLHEMIGLLRRLGLLRLSSGWLRVRVPSSGESRR
jgi:hypothetical protein